MKYEISTILEFEYLKKMEFSRFVCCFNSWSHEKCVYKIKF